MAAKPTADEIEGDRLREEYKRADQRYKWAVGELARQVQAEPLEDFDKFAKYVRETRVETAEALRALNLFESEHPKK